MKQSTKRHQQHFWPRMVIRKWFNIKAKENEYSADSEDEDDVGTDSEDEDVCASSRESRFKNNDAKDAEIDSSDAVPRLRRRKSETFRAHYIKTKDFKVCVGTWNVGGKPPADNTDIDEWLDVREPADIYVVGLQEIVPLNAGNILGAEDTRPAVKWENIIRETLNRVRPEKTKVKCYSDPSSPSRFQPFDVVADIEDELLSETDSEDDEEVHPIDEELDDFDEVKDKELTSVDTFSNSEPLDCTDKSQFKVSFESDFQRQYSSPRRLDRLNCLRPEDYSENVEASVPQVNGKLSNMLRSSERIGLCWPEPPLPLLSQNILERPNSFKSVKSFKYSKSFGRYTSFKSTANGMQSDISMLADIDLDSLINRKRRSPYVRIVSKQMVGVFLTVWVRRSLRRHIQNVKVDTVGVGVMGYIGNKGSISVSMSIYQTPFCFICTHLTSGEKDGDELKRNSDVHEIHRRTQFRALSSVGLPRSILAHERIIWLGDLNYRINLSYEKTRELISKKEWSKLLESDQLTRELKKGRTFDGWSEGTLNFPPTYKYEFNSENYVGEEPKSGRRTPAWCDRILSYGKGMRQLSYNRTELKHSDHRPVTATYMVEVEVFCPKKLQRALTFTDAEIEYTNIMEDMNIDVGMCELTLVEDNSQWQG